jgi:hypothetical protein
MTGDEPDIVIAGAAHAKIANLGGALARGRAAGSSDNAGVPADRYGGGGDEGSGRERPGHC